ncbi:MCE family protein [Aeromicrobium sp. CF4.19]|uniref:MCE family protein n=1 Tax=Aeromicrobium sp. CF4.19 TaxID=3373082 RepID=UPI003EE655A2
MTRTTPRLARTTALVAASAVVLSGCGFSPYDLPLPGGADLGDDPYEVTVEFRDVLDLVPQSAVRVDDIAVGKVTDIELNGWTATATLQINDDVQLPDNAEATLRQSSLLGEKFVALAPPENPGNGELSEGDFIPLERSGRNPDIEEVLGAASLLLNGGGLEKTNTIVKELNKTLDGNEPEIKQLLQTSETFVSQLDDNKEELLTALEKVNNLAVTANEQEGAITEALDELPEALAVLDEQRDGIVGLLEALDRLGDVATGVIRRSKDDTLAVLRDLEPTLKGLADAGDDLATSTQALLSFPFTDEIVGNSVQRAREVCPENLTSDNSAAVSDRACYGDYSNLDIRLELGPDQITSLLEGVLSLGNTLVPSDSAQASASEDEAVEEGEAAVSPSGDLVDLVEGLTPQGQDDEPDPAPQQSGSDSSSEGDGGGNGFCRLLGACRTTPAELMESQDDLGRLLIGPAVAR